MTNPNKIMHQKYANILTYMFDYWLITAALLCQRYVNINRVTCLVESKSVKQEVSYNVILYLTKSVSIISSIVQV